MQLTLVCSSTHLAADASGAFLPLHILKQNSSLKIRCQALEDFFFLSKSNCRVQSLLCEVLLSKHIASTPSISYGLGHF